MKDVINLDVDKLEHLYLIAVYKASTEILVVLSWLKNLQKTIRLMFHEFLPRMAMVKVLWMGSVLL